MHLDYALTSQKLILENWSLERSKEIRYLANLPVTKELDLENMYQTFKTFIHFHKELESIVFLDHNGYVRIDTLSEKGILQSDVSLKDRDYFIEAKEGNEYMYDVVISQVSGKPVVIFSAPVLSENDQFQGVIFGAVYLSKVNQLLRQSIKGTSGELILINHEGMILSHLSNNNNQEREETHTLPANLTLAKNVSMR